MEKNQEDLLTTPALSIVWAVVGTIPDAEALLNGDVPSGLNMFEQLTFSWSFNEQLAGTQACDFVN